MQAVVDVLEWAEVSRRIPMLWLVYPISRIGGAMLWRLRNR
jgi:hypothetical protein